MKLRGGRSSAINQSRFIRAVVDNTKQRLFAMASNITQASVASIRKEMYNNRVNQMPVLNPEKWVHENPGFVEEEVKCLSDAVHLSKPETHLGFIEYKASRRRSSPNKLKKLLEIVNTLSTSQK